MKQTGFCLRNDQKTFQVYFNRGQFSNLGDLFCRCTKFNGDWREAKKVNHEMYIIAKHIQYEYKKEIKLQGAVWMYNGRISLSLNNLIVINFFYF